MFEEKKQDKIPLPPKNLEEKEISSLPPEMSNKVFDFEKEPSVAKKMITIIIGLLVVGGLGYGAYWGYGKIQSSKTKQQKTLPQEVEKNINNEKETGVKAPVLPNDTDGDGLSDQEEIKLGTDPNKVDTDGDGLADYEEVKIYQTNPLNPDTDNDGYLDGQEVRNGYNPKGSGKLDKSTSVGGIVDSFVCGNSIIYGGDSYLTVLIGTQCWFKKNLNIGTMIGSKLADNSTVQNQTNNGITEKYCYSYDKQGDGEQLIIGTTKCGTDGGLYQYDEAINYRVVDPIETDVVQGICPAGWHIPRDSEWDTLVTYLGVTPGTKLKTSVGNPLWDGTDYYGFTALPAGICDIDGSFGLRDLGVSFWSSLPDGDVYAFSRYLGFDSFEVSRNSIDRAGGFSVRCLKD